MVTFSQIIEAIGYDLIQAECGITRQHAYKLKDRNTFPPLYWDNLLVAANKANYPLNKETLRALYQPKLPSKRKERV